MLINELYYDLSKEHMGLEEEKLILSIYVLS